MKGKMKFKGFSFDVNPDFIEVCRKRSIKEKVLLGGKTKVESGALCPSVIKGSGCFYGDTAYERLALLEMLHQTGGAGWLFLPQGSAYKALFKELTVSFNSAKNRYDYSFVFVECPSDKKAQYDFRFTAADDNENLFHIAHRCRVPVERLLELNDYKTPFDVKTGDRVVLK